VIASLSPIGEMLPPVYRLILHKYSEYILKHRVAIHNATDQLPILVALLVFQLEADERHSREVNELSRQIEELRRQINPIRD
jgi:hypothetical protein